jgi:hypothetical protein
MKLEIYGQNQDEPGKAILKLVPHGQWVCIKVADSRGREQNGDGGIVAIHPTEKSYLYNIHRHRALGFRRTTLDQIAVEDAP